MCIKWQCPWKDDGVQCQGIVYQICSDPKITNPIAGHPRVCRHLSVLDRRRELQMSIRYCGQHFNILDAQAAQTSPFYPATPQYRFSSPEPDYASQEEYPHRSTPEDPTMMGSRYLVENYANRYVSIDARDPSQEGPFDDEVQSTVANPPSTVETLETITRVPEESDFLEWVLATFVPETSTPSVTSYRQRRTPGQSREPSQQASPDDEPDSIMADPPSSTGSPESRSPRLEDIGDVERTLAMYEHQSPAPSTQGQ